MPRRVEDHSISRRRLLGAAGATVAASLLPPSAFAAGAAESAVDYYDKLGVAKIINAAGTYTYLTAAVMAPPVQRAVALAAHHPVRLKDLQRASGEYIAKRLKCEGAVVSSGASAALTLATAACIAAKGSLPSNQIPQQARERGYEVIVQKKHRYEYDHAMLICGVTIREVEGLDEYKRAFSERTVMTNYFNSAGPESEPGIIDRETWLKVAHEHGVPCHLDAAADIPPISNLWNYTAMGFDLVCFSGGKGMRGPQNAGLLLGKKRLTDLALENDSPNSDAVGRGMKVAKEQMVGMVAAVDWILDQSDDALQAESMRRVRTIEAALKGIPTLTTSVNIPAVANHVPHLLIKYDPSVVGIKPLEVADRLRAQKPSIELSPATGVRGRIEGADENTIVIGVWMMQPGEAEVVANSLKQVLKHS
ncbi:selenocysteine synthase [Terriglobus tenax]|uniref:selenocysteine synthase n=1 Tax=Terriglobus tenax TaxID=1111115 RepID=UPI0021E0447C|nr:selenocysteine synthase [Terriglobus tenax]